MENEKNISIEKVITNPNLFEFELIKEIVYQRNLPLTRIESEQLLRIVKEKYIKELAIYDDEIKSIYLQDDYWSFIVDLTNRKRWGFVPIRSNDLNEIDQSLINFFGYASKLIAQLIDNAKQNQNNSQLNFPKTQEGKFSPNEITFLFLTMRKRKLIHPKIQKKDLAIVLAALTGNRPGHFTSRISKVKDEIKYDDSILKNLISDITDLLSELKVLREKYLSQI